MVATILCYFHFRHYRSITIILEYSCEHRVLMMLTYLSRLDSNYLDLDCPLNSAARASISHYFTHFAFYDFNFASYVNMSLFDPRNLDDAQMR